jgi:hypothetical protein
MWLSYWLTSKSYWEALYFGTTFVLHRPNPSFPHPSDRPFEECIQLTSNYINVLLTILKKSNTPIAWIDIQGLLFASLTVMVMARSNINNLVRQKTELIFGTFPSWSRNASVCLAIMVERWTGGSLSKLDVQFEAFANDTSNLIFKALASQSNASETQQCEYGDTINLSQRDDINLNMDSNSYSMLGVSLDAWLPAMDLDGASDWGNLHSIDGLYGTDLFQTFWSASFQETD